MGLPLRLEGVTQIFRDGGARQILDIASFALEAGERIALQGPSGAGKTSLLNLLAGIDVPAHGRVLWADEDIAALREPERDRWRRHHVGLVFQDFHLIEGLSPFENVVTPARFAGFRLDPALRSRAEALMAGLGLDPRAPKVETLSRGERQRVALARALLLDPGIILADEPTASLDAPSAHAIARMLVDAATHHRATLIVVTHDASLAQMPDRRFVVDQGRLVEAVP